MFARLQGVSPSHGCVIRQCRACGVGSIGDRQLSLSAGRAVAFQMPGLTGVS